MTPVLAATGPAHLPGWLLLAIAAAVWLAGYLAACAIWPFGNCHRCGGTGKRRSPSGKAFRLCRRCRATGRRLRIGRRIHNYFRSVHDDSTEAGRR